MATSALIVIDMLNPYDHADADELAANVEDMVDPPRLLIDRACESDAEIVYVNDNYGDFAAGRDQLVDAALNGRRRDLVEPFVPPDGVAFLPKVRSSTCRASAT